MKEAARKAAQLHADFLCYLNIAESLATREEQIKSIFEYYADGSGREEDLLKILDWYFDGPEKSQEELRFYCYNFHGFRKLKKASSLFEDHDAEESTETESEFSRLVTLCDRKDIHGSDRTFLFELLERAKETSATLPN